MAGLITLNISGAKIIPRFVLLNLNEVSHITFLYLDAQTFAASSKDVKINNGYRSASTYVQFF